ncbi:hypothetical protein PsYK624_086600 [Phanerochaete sordida]|uniref:Uncharacterized protein n=1 Tax=Phanerochaete sordida TaxID=48140 RepID=A0A9P3GD00_9APHY|nr:hypothetical protein PsYK624_086600 [Phanerochaete sordida]
MASPPIYPHPLLLNNVLYVRDAPPRVKQVNLAATFAAGGCGHVSQMEGTKTMGKHRTWTVHFADVAHAELALATLSGAPVQGLPAPSPWALALYTSAHPSRKDQPAESWALPQYVVGERLQDGAQAGKAAFALFSAFRSAGPLVSLKQDKDVGRGEPVCVVRYWYREHAEAAATSVLPTLCQFFYRTASLKMYDPCTILVTNLEHSITAKEALAVFDLFGGIEHRRKETTRNTQDPWREGPRKFTRPTPTNAEEQAQRARRFAQVAEADAAEAAANAEAAAAALSHASAHDMLTEAIALGEQHAAELSDAELRAQGAHDALDAAEEALAEARRAVHAARLNAQTSDDECKAAAERKKTTDAELEVACERAVAAARRADRAKAAAQDAQRVAQAARDAAAGPSAEESGADAIRDEVQESIRRMQELRAQEVRDRLARARAAPGGAQADGQRDAEERLRAEQERRAEERRAEERLRAEQKGRAEEYRAEEQLRAEQERRAEEERAEAEAAARRAAEQRAQEEATRREAEAAQRAYDEERRAEERLRAELEELRAEEQRMQREAAVRQAAEQRAQEDAARREAEAARAYEEAVKRETDRCTRRDLALYWASEELFALVRFEVVSKEFDAIRFDEGQPLTLGSVPWPTLKEPSRLAVEDITWDAVEAFFKYARGLGSAGQYRSLAEKTHRRFHPDRWRSRRLLLSVRDDALRQKLEAAGNVVAQAMAPIWTRSKDIADSDEDDVGGWDSGWD